MIRYNKGKEILDALFNINLYGEEDRKEKMTKPISDNIDFAYEPYLVERETLVSEQKKYEGLIKTRFDLTKAAIPYYEYLEFEHAVLNYNDSTYSTNTYFTLKPNKTPNFVDFPYTHYIGLFIEMPSFDNEEGEEPTAADYKRINLHKGIISDKISISEAVIDEETGGAMVSNHELMVFPESNTPEGWGTIVGFGIFEEQSGGEPIFWGRLKTPVVVGQAQVPLFRAADFKIILS